MTFKKSFMATTLALAAVLGFSQQGFGGHYKSPVSRSRRINYKPRGTPKAHDMEQYRRRYSHCLSGMR